MRTDPLRAGAVVADLVMYPTITDGKDLVTSLFEQFRAWQAILI